jgi:hypothetical protein
MKFLSSLPGFPKVPRQVAGSTGDSRRSAAESSAAARGPEYRRKFQTAFGWVAPLGRLLPPYSDKLPLPPGYVRLADAWKSAYIEAGRWGVSLDWSDLHLRNSVARRIGEAAARGEVRIAGFTAGSSVACWFPREVWTAPTVIRGRVAYPSYVASQGGLVRLGTGPDGTQCQPFMSLHDLAVLLGATSPPPFPPGCELTITDFPARAPTTDRGADQPDASVDRSAARPGTMLGLPAPSTTDVDAMAPPTQPAAPAPDPARTAPGHDREFRVAANASASTGEDPPKTLESAGGAGGPPSDLHLSSTGLDRRFAAGLIEHGATEERRLPHEPHEPANAAAHRLLPETWPGASDRRPEAGSGVETSATDPSLPMPSSTPVGTDSDLDGARRDQAPSGLGFELSTGMPAAVAPDAGSSSVQVAFGSVPSWQKRDKRKTGRPPLADHLLFPKAREWISTGRSFESVADLCKELSNWLREAHPGYSMDPSSIGGAFYRRGRDLLDALCPPVPVPVGTLPNGRPRASIKAERD